MEHLLNLLIFFPLFCAVLMLSINKESALTFGRIATGIELVLAILLWVNFDSSYGGMQFMSSFSLMDKYGIGYLVGVDGISLFLVILSAFISFIGMVFLSQTHRTNHLVIALLVLETIMIGVFSALDVLLFYLFWELSLVPMLYIIGAWGGEKRLYASIKFFLYTFSASLIMLIGILYFANIYHEVSGKWSFSLLDWYFMPLDLDVQKWLFIAFFIGIAVKVPMFPFHTWLPYAHGQAPTIGSVILAAILLKMGTYAFVRFSIPLFPEASAAYAIPVAILCLAMIIYGALVAFAQKDMKQVIAYSSISHMGVIVLGIFALNVEGIGGGIFFMISHGIVSGALFMLVGVIYERAHTKEIDRFGALAKVMPLYAFVFGVVMMASIGLPLTIGFVGEFLSLLGFFEISPIITLLAGSSIILGAVYMLYLYKNVFFGELKHKDNLKLKDLNAREIATFVPILAIIVWLGVYPKPLLEPINNSVSTMLGTVAQKVHFDSTENVENFIISPELDEDIDELDIFKEFDDLENYQWQDMPKGE